MSSSFIETAVNLELKNDDFLTSNVMQGVKDEIKKRREAKITDPSGNLCVNENEFEPAGLEFEFQKIDRLEKEKQDLENKIKKQKARLEDYKSTKDIELNKLKREFDDSKNELEKLKGKKETKKVRIQKQSLKRKIRFQNLAIINFPHKKAIETNGINDDLEEWQERLDEVKNELKVLTTKKK